MRRYWVVFIGLLVFAASLATLAQTGTSRVTVILQDKTGAVIPEATVRLSNEENNLTSAPKTTTAGSYVFDDVQPGIYTVTVEAQGFKKLVSKGHILTGGVPLAVGLTLYVASIETGVEPSKNVERVQSSTPANSEAVDSPETAAQSEESTKPVEPETQSEEKEKHASRGSIVVAPLPVSSPAIGSGIVAVFGYIFSLSTKDKISPPSVVGAVGMGTDNGSRAFGVGGQLYLKENTYRITAAFIRGNLNYNVYGIGIASGFKLPLKQEGKIFFGEFLRRLGWKFYLGPRFLTGNSLITLEPSGGSPVPIPPDLGIHTTLTSLGARLTRDTSTNRFYPTDGTFFNFTSDFFAKGLGSKYSFQAYRVRFDKYWSLNKDQVLAYDAYFCATGGNPPFYGNCVYGTNNELRGYTAGRYFTRYMVATQLEYRLVLPWRFGLVGFGGLGGTIPGGAQFYGLRKFLPGGGGGLRFLLSKKYHVNLRADYGFGRDGHTFSMGVGEAF